MSVVVDLSQGWDMLEVSKMIKVLPCSDVDKQRMEIQNKLIGEIDKTGGSRNEREKSNEKND